MPLFRIDKKTLEPIKEKPFELEREMQRLTEENIETIFGLEFISSEFELHGLRIDTLVFDPQANTFVIIEYKRDKNFSVVDQGLSYLSLMLNNKADFVLECGERRKKPLRRDEIDWSQARVMFLATSFTSYQQNAINFKDFPVELWEVIRYDNSSILYNRLKTGEGRASIKGLNKNKEIQNVSREIRQYNEEDLIIKGAKSESLYRKLKERVLLVDPTLVVHPTKLYLTFRFPNDWRNFFAVWFRREKLIIELLRSQPIDFRDPEKRVKYRKDSFKNFNQHISQIEVQDEGELEYAIYLIQQLYDRFTKEYK
ncbi:MAG: hypothetical protein HY473_00485 [Candidatus Sungbacteria bacterium]|uniref:DUF5655 domain-containing protein n=1 Tax=Candidatus Sungiibacteriota bacterium TaxID=2750080 RepID=A0A932YYK2_9BACT|nr:hypothetical protein [Candidatus Sungbacteria bacterium]